MGLHAFAMSRFGPGGHEDHPGDRRVVQFHQVDPDRVSIVCRRTSEMPPGGLHIRWPDPPLEQEARMMNFKWYAAMAYVRANRLNHNVIESAERPLRHHRQRQGLQRHPPGPARPRARRRHLPPHRSAPAQGQCRGGRWRLETTRAFAPGLQEILVVEEKRQIIEYQVKEELYNWRPDVRPNVLGKFDAGDADGGEVERAQPERTLAVATAGRPHARTHRPCHCQAAEAPRVDADIADAASMPGWR